MRDAAALRVLITNFRLTRRAGTQLYVLDLALALQKRGHTPIVYSPILGEFAREIRAATIPVVSDLASVGAAPDVIHGHQYLPTLTALLAFPGVPAVTVCHGWDGWDETPVAFPRILRYVAVDHTCRDRLVHEHGISEDRVRVVFNFVDLDRFRPRSPLPPRPARALVFGNSAAERQPHVAAIQHACAAHNIPVDLVGAGSGNPSSHPEEVLPRYDVVFAKAKSAIEAMAVGNSVILCDAAGTGPLVTSANFDELRRLNFGRRALREPASAAAVGRELARYDPDDAAAVSHRIRTTAGREAVADQLVQLYAEVIADQRSRGRDDLLEEHRAAAACLNTLAARYARAELARAGFRRLLQVPLLGKAMRVYASLQKRDGRLSQLLRTLDAD
jgi:hypothetical protein